MNILAITASDVLSKALYILLAILFFGLIIFIHEFGHFIFAKLFKVKVNEFALGMGPTILKKQGKVTKYALRLFPIGGFVSMEGEDEESADENAFGSKAVWKRMIIVAAGGVFNIILGLIICAVIIASADLVCTNEIRNFDGDNPQTEASGLMVGDKILKINGKRIYSMDYDYGFLLQRDKDGVVDLVVERQGERLELPDFAYGVTKNEDDSVTIINDITFVGVKTSFGRVIGGSFKNAVSISRLVYLSLFDLISGQYGLSDMSGPIGTVDIIADVAQESAQSKDYSYVLTIMALITINIGLVNLLPIPALDGGRLFFMFIELIFRKPIPQKYESWVHAVGLVLLLGLIAIISASDIWKIIKGFTGQ